eukprot:c2064_g1_i1 orf=145-771(+)
MALVFLLLISIILSCNPYAGAANVSSTLFSSKIAAALLDFRHHITADPSNALHSWNASSDVCTDWVGVGCNLSDMTISLTLPRLNLSGSISPSALSALNTSLYSLDLSFNNFSGPIPPTLTLCSSLSAFDVSGNSLSGPIPQTLGILDRIEYLDLSANNLIGSIPATLSSCLLLRSLHLGGNKLFGPIPESLGILDGMEDLDLSGNNL